MRRAAKNPSTHASSAINSRVIPRTNAISIDTTTTPMTDQSRTVIAGQWRYFAAATIPF